MPDRRTDTEAPGPEWSQPRFCHPYGPVFPETPRAASRDRRPGGAPAQVNRGRHANLRERAAARIASGVRPRPEAQARVDVLGCPVDAVTLAQALQRIGVAMRIGQRMTHSALNTAKLVKMRNDPALRRDVTEADLITADGMGIVLASRVLGARLPARVTGIDLMDRSLGLCARNGFRPFLLGAKPEILKTAAYRLQLRHPGLQIAGTHHGYFRQHEEGELIDLINASGADCLFVALPSPMKERFIARHRPALQPTFVMGVGGSLDVFAGHVTRAPLWMQNWGLEWLHRTLAEPRRMWRRYLSTNSAFLVLLIHAFVRRRLGWSAPGLVQPGEPVRGDGAARQ